MSVDIPMLGISGWHLGQTTRPAPIAVWAGADNFGCDWHPRLIDLVLVYICANSYAPHGVDFPPVDFHC